MSDLIKRSDAIKAFVEETNGVNVEEAIKVVDAYLQIRECDEVWNSIRAIRDCLECAKYDIAESIPSRITDYKTFCGVPIEDAERIVREHNADKPQGEWIRDRYWSRGTGMGEEYGFFYKCSLCEYEVESGYTRCSFNFCPYCGADMRGEEE